jgi:hypothetical protein
MKGSRLDGTHSHPHRTTRRHLQAAYAPAPATARTRSSYSTLGHGDREGVAGCAPTIRERSRRPNPHDPQSGFSPETPAISRQKLGRSPTTLSSENLSFQDFLGRSESDDLLAMQKVEGSNPFSRSEEDLHLRAFSPPTIGRCRCFPGHRKDTRCENREHCPSLGCEPSDVQGNCPAAEPLTFCGLGSRSKVRTRGCSGFMELGFAA